MRVLIHKLLLRLADVIVDIDWRFCNRATDPRRVREPYAVTKVLAGTVELRDGAWSKYRVQIYRRHWKDRVSRNWLVLEARPSEMENWVHAAVFIPADVQEVKALLDESVRFIGSTEQPSRQ